MEPEEEGRSGWGGGGEGEEAASSSQAGGGQGSIPFWRVCVVCGTVLNTRVPCAMLGVASQEQGQAQQTRTVGCLDENRSRGVKAVRGGFHRR